MTKINLVVTILFRNRSNEFLKIWLRNNWAKVNCTIIEFNSERNSLMKLGL